MRVNKCIPFLSRREVDRYVQEGRVRINEKVASLGSFLSPGDTLLVDDKTVNWEENINNKQSVKCDQFLYLKYWKPLGVTCTSTPQDPSNLIDVGGFRQLGQRVFPIGRLDKDTSGLILLSSDTRLDQAFLHPNSQHKKVYEVEFSSLFPSLSSSQLKQLREGVPIETEIKRTKAKDKSFQSLTLPCEVTILPPSSPSSLSASISRLQVTLIEGRNRQVRKMIEAIGGTVRSLHRIEFGGISLSGLQAEGEWKYLDEIEMNIVREAVSRVLKEKNS